MLEYGLFQQVSVVPVAQLFCLVLYVGSAAKLTALCMPVQNSAELYIFKDTQHRFLVSATSELAVQIPADCKVLL